jgi:site-specific DNA-methyltransferase (adenine-specific)
MNPKRGIDMNIPPAPCFSEEGFTLYQGDCIGILGELPAESVDLIFADPPYNLSNGGFTCQAGRRASVHKGDWDESRGILEDFRFHQAWIQACRRVLRDEGSIWISGTYHSIYGCGYALATSGFHILNDVCWFKPNAPPNLSGRYFTASHETLIWARKNPGSRHCYHYQEMKEGHWPEDPLKKPGRQMRSVWSIPAPKSQEKRQGRHPTQKPCALLLRVIRASSDTGDLVLDPFTGSSTTGIAAAYLRRRFIGIDTNADYLDLSVRRYREFRSRYATDEHENPAQDRTGVTGGKNPSAGRIP